MNAAELALVALGIGLRHAADPDHLAAIGTLLEREPSMLRASRTAAIWGLGHASSFVAVGLPIVFFDLRVPDRFDAVAQTLVAMLLVMLGLAQLRTLVVPEVAERSSRATVARPLVVGLAHGLAGSAGVALLAATTLDSRAAAATYLVLVALGTLAGMVVSTMLLARPLSWGARRGGAFRASATLIPAVLSLVLGVVVGREAWMEWSAS